MFERLIKRTVWEARCKCGADADVKTDNAPRERRCPECGNWVPYSEVSAIGPDLSKTSK